MFQRTDNGFLYVPQKKAPDKIGKLTITFDGGKKWSGLYLHGRHNAVINAFGWLIIELNDIEPLSTYGWDGGYADRPIKGSTRLSCHASGTAHDHNAAAHPMGWSTYEGFTTRQVTRIQNLLSTKYGRFFRWGAYFSRHDPMHFQLADASRFRRYGHEIFRDGSPSKPYSNWITVAPS